MSEKLPVVLIHDEPPEFATEVASNSHQKEHGHDTDSQS